MLFFLWQALIVGAIIRVWVWIWRAEHPKHKP